ncbi:MAG TPA: carboxypeptidase-like regulatory domain-containing protein [Terriglobales bacterium]|nr:carboxypeptidase-like regulatory domain-containing protein [Terriglobales bacterium]
MKFSRLAAFVLLALTFFIAVSASAQSDRGAISGSVVDGTGAVVAGAKITATNVVTGEKRTTESSATGTFLVPELKANPWKVTVEATGFKTATTGVIQVAVQVTQRVTITLEIGAVSQMVTVEGAAAVIQTENPVLQTNVTERQVKEMPLMVQAEIGGRTPLAFIFLDSNVTSSDSNRQQNATFFRVNGGQALGAEILVDGANTRRAQNGSYFTEVAPGPNAFQEFTYSTTSYSAEFGNSSAGVVNFTLKSGTNSLHGEAYEMFRNEALNANGWKNNYQKTEKGRDRQNDFGFNLGGPVYIPKIYDGRSKTFFFTNYNGYRFNKSENTYITVPTLKMRTGDFSELLTDPYVLQYVGGPQYLFDPHQVPSQRIYNADGTIGQQIPGNRLDLYQGGALLDPVGMALMNYFPKPTRDGVYHNYLAQSSAPFTVNSYTEKIDHVLSDKQRLAVSYSYRAQTAIKGGFPRMPYPAIATGVWDQDFISHYARAQHDYTISNNILNHFNLGWNRVYVANKNSTYGFDTLSLGLPPNATPNLTFPMIEFPGYNGDLDPRAVQGMGSTWWHDEMGDNMVQASDSLTWVKGKHTFKFGGDIRIQQLNVFQNFDNGGHFNFRHDQTAGVEQYMDGEEVKYRAVGGWTLASLATGATEWSWVTVTDAKPAWRMFSQAYFINDDFKVTPKLTLNLGFRYELTSPRTEAHNYYRAFDPTAMNPEVNRLGAMAGAGGQGGVTAKYRGMFETDKTDISPRVGFAYAIDDKTVVRGGMGVYYAPFLYDASSGILGYRTSRNIIPPYEQDWGGLGTNAFLSTYPNHWIPNPNGQFIGSDVDYYQPDAKAGRTTQWTLDVQRELPKNFVVKLGYIGNKGTRLRTNIGRLNALPYEDLKLGWEILRKNINALTEADRAYASSIGVTLPASGNAVFQGFNGSVAQALKPFPQYNRINNQLESRGQSWYHAMNLKVERRFAQGLQFAASYTLSKLLTTAGDDLWGNTPLTGVLQNPYDTASLKSLSPSNATHVLVFNYIYELPFGKGKPFLNSNSIVDKIVGGWQINGIHRYQGGMPLTATINNGEYRDFLETVGYYGNLRPNLTGQSILTNNQLSGYSVPVVNPGAFAPPPRYSAPPTTNVADPAYKAYYADPSKFFGTAPAVLNARAMPYYSENLSVLKKVRIKESVATEFGVEFFNPFNRHRYWMPDMNLDTWVAATATTPGRWRNGGFGTSSVYDDYNAYSPRVIQLRLRVTF